jgi:hypothetical protein
MLSGQHPHQALALQQAARTSAAALPSRTRLKDGGVAFFGRSGLDSTAARLLAVVVVGLAVAAALLVSRAAPLAAVEHWRRAEKGR